VILPEEFVVMFNGPFSKKAPIKDEHPGPPSSQIMRLSFSLSDTGKLYIPFTSQTVYNLLR